LSNVKIFTGKFQSCGQVFPRFDHAKCLLSA